MDCWFQPHRRHCVVSLSKNINPSLVLVQPNKTCPFITEKMLMGRKESNQTSKFYRRIKRHKIEVRFEFGGQGGPVVGLKYVLGKSIFCPQTP